MIASIRVDRPITHEAEDAAELLERFVQGRDVPCPACAYNLRNTASLRCPECGAELHLQVGSPRQRLGAWLTVLLAAALPLGFYLTTAAMAVEPLIEHLSGRGSAFRNWRRSDWIVLGLLIGASAISGLIVLVAARARSRFGRWSGGRRWGIAITVVAAMLLFHVAIVFAVLRAITDSF
jgi:hypothetical protein